MPRCWSTRPAFSSPCRSLDYDRAAYDAYLELDRAIFFLTQTVARGMVARGWGGSVVNIGSMCAHQAVAATPSSGYSVAKGACTRSPATWPWSWPRIRSGSTRLRRPSWPPSCTNGSYLRTSSTRLCTALTASTARPDRHRARSGQHHHLPALAGDQLGHRRDLGRRRRRRGRTQLRTR
jgi:hypothetical protein